MLAIQQDCSASWRLASDALTQDMLEATSSSQNPLSWSAYSQASPSTTAVLCLVLLLSWLIFQPSQAQIRDESNCLYVDLYGNGDSAAASSAETIARMVSLGERISCCRYLSPLHNSSSLGVWLTVLLPLYSASSDVAPSSACTRPRQKLMVQLVEAVRLLLQDTLRQGVNKPFLKYLRGIEIRDTCGLNSATVEETLNIGLQSKYAADVCHSSDDILSSGECPEQGNEELRHQVGAVIGPALSTVLEVASPVLSAYAIPHTSYWATSNLFSSKTEYPYLFRTATMDHFAARAIIGILHHFHWIYISLVQGTFATGLPSIADDVRTLRGDICIAIDEQFRRNDKEKMKEIAHKLVNESSSSTLEKPSIVVFIAGYIFVQEFFSVVETLAKEDMQFASSLSQSHFVWIASDGWISRAIEIFPGPPRCQDSPLSLGRHSILGPVFRVPNDFIKPSRDFLTELDSHLHQTRVTSAAVLANPWLGAAWRDRFGCCVMSPSASCPPCNKSEAAGEVYDTHVLPTLSGSFWLAYKSSMQLLDDAITAKLAVSNNEPQYIEGTRLRSSMLNTSVSCSSPSGYCPVYHENQETTPAFSFFAVVFEGCARSLQEIGYWEQTNTTTGLVRLMFENDERATFWASESIETPSSICALPCQPGYEEVSGSELTDEASANSLNVQTCSACWLCSKCPTGQFRSTSSSACAKCEVHFIPNSNQSGCVKAQETYIDFSHVAAKTILASVGVSLLAVLLLAVLVCKYTHHELVKQGGTGQSLALLLVISLGYSTMCFFFFKPTVYSCVGVHLAVTWTVTLCNILILSRLFRLAALSEDQKDAPAFFQLLSKHFGKRSTHQASFVLLFGTISMTILSLVLAIQPLTILQEMRMQKLLIACETPLPFTLAASIIPILFLVPTLLCAFRFRRLQLYMSEEAATGGPQEGQLLHRLSITLSVIYVSFLPTYALTPAEVEFVVMAVALLLYYGAIVYFLYVPRALALLSPCWSKICAVFSCTHCDGGDGQEATATFDLRDFSRRRSYSGSMIPQVSTMSGNSCTPYVSSLEERLDDNLEPNAKVPQPNHRDAVETEIHRNDCAAPDRPLEETLRIPDIDGLNLSQTSPKLSVAPRPSKVQFVTRVEIVESST